MARVNSTPPGAGDRRRDKRLSAAGRMVHNLARPGKAHVIVRSAVGSSRNPPRWPGGSS